MIAVRSLIAACACALACAPASAHVDWIDKDFAVGGRYQVVPNTDPANHVARTYAFNAIGTLPDGSLMAAGFMDRSQPIPLSEPDFRVIVAKLHADGSPDLAFGNDEAHPGLLVLEDMELTAFMETANSIAALDDGSVIVGGAFDDGQKGGFTLRFDADGKMVDDYGQDGMSRLPMGVFDMAVDSQERVIAVGIAVRDTAPAYRGMVARIDADNGELDADFGDAGLVEMLEHDEQGDLLDRQGALKAVVVGPDDSVYVGGAQENWTAEYGYWFEYSLAKLMDDGQFDPAFADDGWLKFSPTWSQDSRTNVIADIAIQNDKLLVTGGYLSDKGDVVPMIGRFSLQGQPDPAFGQLDSPGFALPELFPDYSIRIPVALQVQEDGRIVLGLTLDDPMRNGYFAVARFTADGAPDANFRDDGQVLVTSPAPSVLGNTHAVTLQPDRIVIAGIDGFRDEFDHLYIGASVIGISMTKIFPDNFESE